MTAGESRFFCCDASRETGEPITGTVARIDSWLLIEYPGIWRRDAIAGSGLGPEIRAHLDAFAAARPLHRQLFIRQGYGRCAPFRCFYAETREASSRLLYTELPSYDALGSPLEAEDAGEPVFLVCTHGNHDKCCAKFGIPVYHALREQSGARAWECSHVGGDRFAANVVVLPHGIYYGRVTPADVPRLLEATARREIVLDLYRGRCCYPRAVQIAEALLRRETGRAGLDDFRLVPGWSVDGTRRKVLFSEQGDGRIHAIEYEVRETGKFEYPTCGAAEPRSVLDYPLRGHALL